MKKIILKVSGILIMFFISSNLLAQTAVYDRLNGKMGVVNVKGEFIIRGKYDVISVFFDNVAVVSENEKYGLIDSNGKLLIPIEYDFIDEFHEGLLAAKKNGQYGFIDKNNKIVVPFIYDGAGSFHNGITWIQNGEVYGVINKKGEEIISTIYENAFFLTENRILFAKKGGKLYKIDSTGVLNSIKDTDWRQLERDESTKDNLFAFFWEEGLDVTARPFSGHKVGYENKNREIIIPAKFKMGFAFHDEIAVVYENENIGLGFINKRGEYIVKPNVEWKFIEGDMGFVNGLCKILKIDIKKTNEHEKNKQKAREDYKNKLINQMEFYKIMEEKFTSYAYIDREGKVVFDSSN